MPQPRTLLLTALLLSCILPGTQALAAPETAADRPPRASSQRAKAKAANPLLDPDNACARCLRAHMEFLAGDALRGRGSATHDELVAATYIAAQLRQYGVAPAGDGSGEQQSFLQTAELQTPVLAAPPTLTFTAGDKPVRFTHGAEFILSRSSGGSVKGPLQKMGKELAKPNPGAIVLWQADTGGDARKWFAGIVALLRQGAVAVLSPANDDTRKHWAERVKERPLFQRHIAGVAQSVMTFGPDRDIALLTPEAMAQLAGLADGAPIEIATPLAPPRREYTTNVVGILRGTNKDADKDAILLTAHLDHLGVDANAKGDNIYNGAADDASGSAAVLELARVLATGPRPKRTVVFALFGSEETGGLGSTYFLEHSPVALGDITANLEFEMLAWPDPKLQPNVLWLTGFDRTDFGPELAKHGANVVPDPYPAQNFFQRSDNYILAKKGVVAQTIGSFGLQKEYHSPQDDLAHVDWEHFTKAVDSLLEPIEWLVNSDFKPQWLPGKKP